MIMPNRNTPVQRCVELAQYTEHMLRKFPDNARLILLAGRVGEGGGALEAAHRAYEDEQRVLALRRIDVDYENYLADASVRRMRKLLEVVDRRGGRIMSQVFPAGFPDVSRIQGARQVAAMSLLEVRLQGVQDLWPDAAVELAELVVRRTTYSDALDARKDCERRSLALRVARDAAKERFLQLYAEVVSLVQAEFPRDRATQELFFRDAYERRPAATPDDGEDTPIDDTPDDEPADNA
jgi:hypothetical protein